MQQTETYHTALNFKICGSLFICILTPLQSLDTASHTCDLSFPGTKVNFLQLSHTDQWKFMLKFSRTCQVKSNKYSFLIASKRLFLWQHGVRTCFVYLELNPLYFSFDSSCAVVRYYNLNFFNFGQLCVVISC